MLFNFFVCATGTVERTAKIKNGFPIVSDILAIDSVEVKIWLKSHSSVSGFSEIFTQRKTISDPDKTV